MKISTWSKSSWAPSILSILYTKFANSQKLEEDLWLTSLSQAPCTTLMCVLPGAHLLIPNPAPDVSPNRYHGKELYLLGLSARSGGLLVAVSLSNANRSKFIRLTNRTLVGESVGSYLILYCPTFHPSSSQSGRQAFNVAYTPFKYNFIVGKARATWLRKPATCSKVLWSTFPSPPGALAKST
ncbi:hypothetical protein ACA910_002964 [Epithemia clementina (nom. ined.)]